MNPDLTRLRAVRDAFAAISRGSSFRSAGIPMGALRGMIFRRDRTIAPSGIRLKQRPGLSVRRRLGSLDHIQILLSVAARPALNPDSTARIMQTDKNVRSGSRGGSCANVDGG